MNRPNIFSLIDNNNNDDDDDDENNKTRINKIIP